MNSIWFATAVCAFTLVGCGPSKVDQCNAVIERGTKAQAVMSSLHFESGDPAAIEQDAVKLDAESKAMAAVDIKDEKLIGMRNDYGANLAKLAKITRDVATAYKDAKDPAKAAAVQATLPKLAHEAEAIEKTESGLVDQVNGYCSGK
jgi:hypothetical protein